MNEKKSTSLWIQMLGLVILLSAALWAGYYCGSRVQAENGNDLCGFSITRVSCSQSTFWDYTISGTLENRSTYELIYSFETADGQQIWTKNVSAGSYAPFSISWSEEVNGYPIGCVLRITTERTGVLLYQKYVVLYPVETEAQNP